MAKYDDDEGTAKQCGNGGTKELDEQRLQELINVAMGGVDSADLVAKPGEDEI